MRDTSARVSPVTGRRRAPVQFLFVTLAGPVMEQKCVAVRREDKRDIEGRRVLQALLHAAADRMVVILCLDQGDGNIRLVVENVVGALRFAAGDQFAANDDAASREVNLLADL